MPFLGKDWRSSGDEWIRTELGWERTKVLECILDNLNTGLRHAKTGTSKSRMSILNENDHNNNSIINDDNNNEANINLEQISNNSEDEDDDLFSDNDDVYNDNETDNESENSNNTKKFSFSRLSISTSSMDKCYKPKQPHIIYFNFENIIRKVKNFYPNLIY